MKQKYKLSKVTQLQVANIAQFKTNFKFTLDEQNSMYILFVESGVLLDCLILQSVINLEIEDFDKNCSITTKVNYGESQSLLATCRLIESNNNIKIKIQTKEGIYGDLQVELISGTTPKASFYFTCSIKPLSLHKKVHEKEINSQDRFDIFFEIDKSDCLMN